MWLKNCSMSEKSGPGLRCFWLLPGWSQLSVWIWRLRDPSVKPAMCSQKHRYRTLTHTHIRKTSNNRTSLLLSTSLFQVHSCCETLQMGAQTRFMLLKFMPSQCRLKAWPTLGAQNLLGGTQTRWDILGHLPLSNAKILNLEMAKDSELQRFVLCGGFTFY